MKKLGIEEDLLHEQFVRSAGAGGQNVNKRSTCVKLFDPKHNLRVECQKHRSQNQNRIGARELLCLALKQLRTKEEEERQQKQHRARARNRRRPASLKRKILESKRRRSKVKASRRKPSKEL